jgi:hypothetical protein
MAERAIDLHASTVTVRTRAKGLLSRLAHDLEIEAGGFSGQVDVDSERWRGTLRFPVKGMRVVGALRGARVDRAILSADDRAEIERRLAALFDGGEPAVTVDLEGETRRRAQAVVRTPAGQQRVAVDLDVEERRDGEIVASGKTELSLSALGLPEVKGPLGAFKVDDSVEVGFWLMLSR